MRTLLAFGLMATLAACAGRLPNPIEVEQAGDFSLSCVALEAEFEGNRDKHSFLQNRDAVEESENLSVGVLAFTLAQPAFFGLDLSDANQDEMAALEQRRERLVSLMASQGCHIQDRVPTPYRAYVREEKVYVDEAGRQLTLPVNHFVYSTRGADRLAARDQSLPGF